MGKVSQLGHTFARIEAFKAKYDIPLDVEIRPCEDGEVAENKGHWSVVIPLVAFVDGGGGVQIPMGDILVYFLKHFKLCPDQCAQNVF